MRLLARLQLQYTALKIMPKQHPRALTKRESELFRLITNVESDQLKEFLHIYKRVIDFSKKGNRGYTALEVAVLTKNKEILATLLATLRCEPVNNALVLAIQLKYHDGVNIFIKYLKSEKREIRHTVSLPIERNQSFVDYVDHENDESFALELQRESHVMDSPKKLQFDGFSIKYEMITKPDKSRIARARTNARDYESKAPKINDDVNVKRKQSGVIPANLLKNMSEVLRKAAIAEDYTIIEMLVNAGFSLKDPFDETAPGGMHSMSETMHILEIIETYRAMCSAPFIALTKRKDPIKASFDRSEQLVRLSTECPESKTELQQLAEKSSKFAVDLLNLCQSEDEIRPLMKLRMNVSSFAQYEYGRLLLAIRYQQKEFVAHPNCQHVMSSLWLGHLSRHWPRWGKLKKLFHVIFQILLMPIMCITTLLCPKSKHTVKATVPFNRFLYDLTSYFTFLIFILVILLYSANGLTSCKFMIHWVAFVYVIAAWIKLITNVLPFAGKQFVHSFWCLYEVFMYLIFTVAFICILFLKDLQLLFLPLGNGFLSVAFILAVTRTLQYLQLHPALGPFIIAFARIVSSLFKLFVVFLVFYFGFSVSLYALYRHKKELATEDTGVFVTYSRAVQALLWAIFGQGEAAYAKITNDETTESEDFITEAIGMSLWGLFHLACVVVLMNMVIALMTYKYDQVTSHCDMEWKFARTELWLYYLEDCNRMPVPFNIVLFIQNVIKCFPCRKKGKYEVDTESGYNTDSAHFGVRESDEYSDLMNILIDRYFQKEELQMK